MELRRRPSVVAARWVCAVIALTACSDVRRVASDSAPECTRCHGGGADLSGAPPQDTLGRSDTSLPSVGSHASHIAAGLDCDACHPKPAPGDRAHIDGVVAMSWSALATANGTLTPRYDRSSNTCTSVYCHGAFTDGNRSNAPRWAGADPGDAACGTCHEIPPPAPHPVVSGGGLAACALCHPATIDPAGNLIARSAGGAHLNGIPDVQHDEGWTDPASAGFHAFAANRAIAGCTSCHGSDLAGGASGVGCGRCHDQALPPGVASWDVNCVMCHGGEQNGTGAPPKATWGNAADVVRVGAHTAHVSASSISPAFGCEVCHVTPASALTPGHLDGETATVTFDGLAASGAGPAPAWDRATATCSNTYCHAAGGSYPTPVWTRPGLEGYGCGACHLTPPGDTYHRNNHWGLACSTCHPGASMTSVAPATHVNGTKDVVNPRSGTPWTSGWNDCGPCHTY